jgi:DNA-binding NtrC family response regulator
VEIGSRDGRRYVLAMRTHASVESSQLANVVLRLLEDASGGSVEDGQQALENGRREPGNPASQNHAVFASQTMVTLLSTAKRAAATDVSVLITGESGSGKEVLARYLHGLSRRSAGRFVPVNCPAIQKELFDSQLFGHRKGAFTGAVESFDGIIHGAAGGTLFLDEIGELPLDVQPKLLRFLDSHEIHTLGETHPKQVDVRVIAATNVDLEQLIADGRFRRDLFYRLSVFSLHVPPLRDRRDDVKALVEKFFRDLQLRLDRPSTTLSPTTMALLCLYDWPGNVRQLSSEIHRLVALSEDGEEIGPDLLSPQIFAKQAASAKGDRPSSDAQQPHAQQALRHLVDDAERTAVEQALADAGGSQTEAARRLGLSRKGLYLKRLRLGIQE